MAVSNVACHGSFGAHATRERRSVLRHALETRRHLPRFAFNNVAYPKGAGRGNLALLELLYAHADERSVLRSYIRATGDPDADKK